MPDCSGYGIATRINLCVDGAVGNGQTANLQISLVNTDGLAFNESMPLVVNNWDGSKIVVDVSPALVEGFSNANCDLDATLTITPDGDGTTGTMLLKYVLTNCVGGDETMVFENCGGAGPHIISEMSTFNLDGGVCV